MLHAPCSRGAGKGGRRDPATSPAHRPGHLEWFSVLPMGADLSSKKRQLGSSRGRQDPAEGSRRFPGGPNLCPGQQGPFPCKAGQRLGALEHREAPHRGRGLMTRAVPGNYGEPRRCFRELAISKGVFSVLFCSVPKRALPVSARLRAPMRTGRKERAHS